MLVEGRKQSPSFDACKNSTPAEKSTHFAFHASSGTSPSDDSMFLNVQELMNFKVFLAAKLPLYLANQKVSEHPPARENRSSHNDNRVSHKEA